MKKIKTSVFYWLILGFVLMLFFPNDKVEASMGKIKAISTENGHSLILTEDGSVYSFGLNGSGQLGLGDTMNRNAPTKINTISGAVAVSAGVSYSLVLTEDGSVYSFGSNTSGQLGHGDTMQRNKPTKISTISHAVAVSAGAMSHSLILTEDGSVYSFGDNTYGHLGHGDTTPRNTPTKVNTISHAVAVSAGMYFSLVLTEDGSIYSFGDNRNGQLGHGDTTQRNIPTKINAISKAVAVSTGNAHSLVLTEDGSVYSFGGNYYGGLGHGDTTQRNIPTKINAISKAVAISAGGANSFILTEEGSVYSFGYNGGGHLGHGDKLERNTPTKINTINGAVAINTGTSQSLVLTEDGSVYSFGGNSSGQLGLGDTTDRTTPTKITNFVDPLLVSEVNKKMKTISAGDYHSLVLTEDGSVYSFGYSNYGQLGHENTLNRHTPTKINTISHAVAVSAGGYHSLILTEDGSVYSFGDNEYGQLGQGDTTQRNTPTKINTISKAVAVSAGTSHSLILTEDGSVYSFGYNEDGELGHGDTIERLVPTKINTISKAVAISAGTYHSLVLTEDGSVYSFGYNYNGQLGHGDTIERLVPTKINTISKAVSVNVGSYHSLVLTEDGSVYSFGYNEYGQLGHGDTIERLVPTKINAISHAVAMNAGTYHSLVLTEDGSVYSFGRNSNGQLGHGDYTDRNIPTKINTISKAVAISAGEVYSLILTEDESVYSFGYNDDGQLGHGDYNNRNVPTKIVALMKPIMISTCSDLQNMNMNLSGNYALANDIDCTATSGWSNGLGFKPIGDDTNLFTGVIDGNGYAIRNLTINRTSEGYIGLFGSAENATIKNLKLENVNIKGKTHVGSLVGIQYYSSITNSYATGNIEGESNAGGLVGINNNSVIKESYSTIDVVGTKNDIGGLTGINNGGRVENSYATGNVKGQSYVGGLVGENNSVGSLGNIVNAYALGKVVYTSNGGGLVGYANIPNLIVNSYYDKDTSGQSDTGKGTPLTDIAMRAQANFTGWDFTSIWVMDALKSDGYPKLRNNLEEVQYTMISTCTELQNINLNLSGYYALSKDIDCTDFVGFAPIGGAGFAFKGVFDGKGYTVKNLTINRPTENYVAMFGNSSGAIIRNINLEKVKMTGKDDVAGLIGFAEFVVIINVNIEGEVVGNGLVGGLVGIANSSVTIEKTSMKGNVTGANDVGGLVGYTNGFSTIKYSYATANVKGTNKVGGLIGSNMYHSAISDTYATGNVDGTGSFIGGLVGQNTDGARITNSYATGKVTSVGAGGGLAGLNGEVYGSVITNSYYNKETSKQSDTGKGIPYTTAQMKTQSNFVGWDFSTVWVMNAPNTDGYPKLRSNVEEIEYTMISTCMELQNMKNNLTGYYALATDIDCTATSGWNNGAGFEPIGNGASKFTGTLDGRGYTVTGLTINRPTENYVGLFRYTDGLILQNIKFTELNVKGKSWVGGIVGYQGGNVLSLIDQVHITGKVYGDSGQGEQIGGFAGISKYTNITNSSMKGEVMGSVKMGGLFGSNDGWTYIRKSYVTGFVIGSGYNVGGLVGENYGTIVDSYATGTIRAGSQVGGLAGMQNGGSITNSYAKSSVTATSGISAGGVIGSMNGGFTDNVFYDKSFDGERGFGFGLTSQEMRTQSNFVGWNFSSIWIMDAPNTDGYPKLKDNLEELKFTMVSTCTELQQINVNKQKNYALTNDIDCSGTEMWNSGAGFLPIGDNSDQFSGIFDGRGFTIKNITINRPTQDYIGLFGYTVRATIKDVKLENIRAIGKTYVGGLVGLSFDNSFIQHTQTTGVISGSTSVGGLVGYNYNYSTVESSYSSATVTALNKAGGLVGETFHYAMITKSYATGDINATNGNAGGLIGVNANYSTISESYATGNVISSGSYVAGFAGNNQTNSKIFDSYATGNVQGDSYVAAFVGVNNSSSIVKNSYAIGKITGSTNLGGIISINYSSMISSYFDIETTGYNDSEPNKGMGLSTAMMKTQGIYDGWDFSTVWIMNAPNTDGYPKLRTNVEEIQVKMISTCTELQNMKDKLNGHYELANDIDCTATSSWNGGTGFVPIGGGSTHFTGVLDGKGYTIKGLFINRPTENHMGLFGYIKNAKIKNIKLTQVNIKGGSNVGGLSAQAQTSMIEYSSVEGSIVGSNSVGGLLGINGAQSTVSYSNSKGTITALSNVGGLVGYNTSSNIVKSYSTAEITARDNVGGLVGYSIANSYISDSYATGNIINGGTSVGGLVGNNYDYSTINNSYATGNVQANFSKGGLVGKNDYSTVNSSYYNKETSGQNDNTGKGTPFTTLQMKAQSNFTSWDFSTVWIMNAPHTDGYPKLRENIEEMHDTTPPIGILTLSHSTWTNTDVVITAVGSDAESGVKHIKLPSGMKYLGDQTTYTVSSNGTYTFEFEDIEGNVLVESIEVVMIDKTKPTIIFDSNNREWAMGSVNVQLFFADTGGSSYKDYRYQWTKSTVKPTSGWSSWQDVVDPTVTQSTNGVWYLHVEANDLAGNTTYEYRGPYKIDLTAPVLTMDFSEILEKQVYSYDGMRDVNFKGTITEESAFQVYYNIINEKDGTKVIPSDVKLLEQNEQSVNTSFNGSYQIDSNLESGTYRLKVTAKNQLGATRFATVTFEVEKVSIPSAPSVNVHINPQPTGKWENKFFDVYVTDSGDMEIVAAASKKYEITNSPQFPLLITKDIPSDRKITLNQIGANYLHVQYTLDDGTKISSTAGPYLVDTASIGDFEVKLLDAVGNEVNNWSNENLKLSIGDPSVGSVSGYEKQYYIENYHTDWQVYTPNTSIKMEGSNRVFARIVSKAGMISEQKYKTAMIDKTLPKLNKLILEASTEGDYGVTVLATDSISGIRSYQLDNGVEMQTNKTAIEINNITTKPTHITITDKAGNKISEEPFAPVPQVTFEAPYTLEKEVYKEDVKGSIAGGTLLSYKLGNKTYECGSNPCTFTLSQNTILTAINTEGVKQTKKVIEMDNINKKELRLIANGERDLIEPNKITINWNYTLSSGLLKCKEDGMDKTYPISGKSLLLMGKNYTYNCLLEATYGGENLVSNPIMIYPDRSVPTDGNSTINEEKVKANIYYKESIVGKSYYINTRLENFGEGQIPLPKNRITID